MSLKITIDIFSGRENPVIELTEQESLEALKQLKPIRKIEEKRKEFPPEPILGYRGLIIEQTGKPDGSLPKVFLYVHGDLFGERLAHKAASETFEEFVCGSTGLITRLKLGKEFSDFVLEEIERLKELRFLLDPQIVELREKRLSAWWPCRWWCPCYWWWWRRCKCAPLYEPSWWNDSGQIQYNNNCYNYATNYRTDTYAQPGEAANAKWTNLSACDVPSPDISAKMGAISDCLIDDPAADNRCPSKGHLVALVIRPGDKYTWDYHWYRKGRNKYWSHKPGGGLATNLDNAGNPISDPRTANRGSYTEFCTFMKVMHGHVKIK
ncbi:MAG: hypothetical protein KAV87_68245 [Desulfobacteraceae bacterium]|nr:hypothetical protein [Desulfobacteraceae bacterium]